MCARITGFVGGAWGFSGDTPHRPHNHYCNRLEQEFCAVVEGAVVFVDP